MAAPPHKVQLLKKESVAGGGDAADEEEGFPTGLDPTEDAPEVHGVYLQYSKPTDKLVYVTRDASGNMVFRDVTTGAELTLSDLAGGVSTDLAWRRHFLVMGG